MNLLFITLFRTLFPGSSNGKESACNSGDLSSIPGSGRSPGEGHGTPVFLPGKFHGQRSLVGYSPKGCKESDTTEVLSTYTSLVIESFRQKKHSHVVLVTQSCPTLSDPTDCSQPGILSILEWVAVSFSRGSSWPRDGIWVSCIAGRCFII